MFCPYCKRRVEALTGFMEAEKFAKHLQTCRKNPNNLVMSDGTRTVVVPQKIQNLMDALEIRAESGQ